ncbi:putative 28S rRNA (cytosine-C(5))-methyltransferase, partial [Lasiodiplodia hormozganensis]
MSLYYEAATILENADNVGGSLTSRIYGKKGLKSKPTAIYALVTEATKWSAVLKDVVENSGILKLEKKLIPLLAVLLTHDLLISKGGVAAPANHPLKLAITRHKARLSAEFTKLRVKRGFSTLDAFRQHINACAESGISANSDASSSAAPSTITEHPRWVRVNAVRTTLDAQLRTTFAEYARKEKLADVMAAPATAKVLHIDAHIPNLLALPPRADLSRVKAYQAGELIIQDKASCFPAYLLNVQPGDGDAIDGCAAPGNKTTHLAAIVAENNKIVAAGGEKKKTPKQRIIACERDKRRSGILEKMVNLAGAGSLVTVKQRQDFLNLDPHSPELASVGAILLDPSCSGSGIVSRDDDVKLVLPSAPAAAAPQQPSSARGKKRKRKGTAATPPQDPPPTTTLPLTEQETEDTDNKTDTDLSA